MLLLTFCRRDQRATSSFGAADLKSVKLRAKGETFIRPLQVRSIELSRRLQFFPVQDGDGMIAIADELLTRECFHRAIDVHSTETKGIAKLGLRNRKW